MTNAGSRSAGRPFLRVISAVLVVTLLGSCTSTPSQTDATAPVSVPAAPQFAAPGAPPQRPEIRVRPATADEKLVFDREVSVATRRRLEQAPTPEREADSGWVLTCILLPLACLTAIVALPLVLAEMFIWEKAEEWAPLRTGEKVVREASLETMLIQATRRLQDDSLPPSTDQVLEYRLVRAAIAPWKPHETFPGYCLSVAVDLAFQEGGRTTWREPYVVGGGDRSPDASDASCWDFAGGLPSSEDAWQKVIDGIASDIAQGLRRRTPGAGWLPARESTSDAGASHVQLLRRPLPWGCVQ